MDSCDYGFIIMVKGRASFVKNQILSHKGKFETKRACAITQYHTYGITIREKLYTDDTTDRYFHLYYKSARANAERTQLENLLLRMAETMDKGKGRNIEFGKSYEHYYELTYHEKNGDQKILWL